MCFQVLFFLAEAGIVPNLFLNFEQKRASYSCKIIVLLKKVHLAIKFTLRGFQFIVTPLLYFAADPNMIVDEVAQEGEGQPQLPRARKFFVVQLHIYPPVIEQRQTLTIG